MLIVVPVFFQTCQKCERHGRMVFHGKIQGVEFGSKESGKREIENLRSEKRISEHEYKYLEESIMGSMMPHHEKHSNPLVWLACLLDIKFGKVIVAMAMDEVPNQSQYIM